MMSKRFLQCRAGKVTRKCCSTFNFPHWPAHDLSPVIVGDPRAGDVRGPASLRAEAEVGARIQSRLRLSFKQESQGLRSRSVIECTLGLCEGLRSMASTQRIKQNEVEKTQRNHAD